MLASLRPSHFGQCWRPFALRISFDKTLASIRTSTLLPKLSDIGVPSHFGQYRRPFALQPYTQNPSPVTSGITVATAAQFVMQSQGSASPPPPNLSCSLRDQRRHRRPICHAVSGISVATAAQCVMRPYPSPASSAIGVVAACPFTWVSVDAAVSATPRPARASDVSPLPSHPCVCLLCSPSMQPRKDRAARARLCLVQHGTPLPGPRLCLVLGHRQPRRHRTPVCPPRIQPKQNSRATLPSAQARSCVGRFAKCTGTLLCRPFC